MNAPCRIIAFGEILWDLFPDARQNTIGGAPFNVAAHLRQLGADVTFVSAVGQDAAGTAAREILRRFALDTPAVATLPAFPTGSCRVTLQNGTPSYHLTESVAYDSIPLPALTPPFDAIYYGSLAARAATSRRTLLQLLQTVPATERFLDINIRKPYWSPELLHALLPFATTLKFSREEAYVFGNEPLEALCRTLARQYPNLRRILVTLDRDGAFLFSCGQGTSKDSILHVSCPPAQHRGGSTVGAGDAFSACFLFHLLRRTPANECLRRATLLASYVVSRLGAVPDYPPDLLARLLAETE